MDSLKESPVAARDTKWGWTDWQPDPVQQSPCCPDMQQASLLGQNCSLNNSSADK